MPLNKRPLIPARKVESLKLEEYTATELSPVAWLSKFFLQAKWEEAD